MTEKTTAWLGWLTLAAILAALWLLFGEDPTKDPGARGEKLFVGLSEQMESVQSVSVTSGDINTTLRKDGENWVVADRGDYPADISKLSPLLRSMIRSERREPKTLNKDRFADLGLGDLGTMVTLSDSAGQRVASVDLGTRRAVGPERSLTYVYKSGDSRAWVASHLVDVSAEPADWLDPALLTFGVEDVVRIELGDAVLTRLGDDFTVDSLADGETLKPAYELTAPARTFASLGFRDVTATANPLVDPLRTVAMGLRTGVTITANLYAMSGGTYAQFTVSVDESATASEDFDPAALAEQLNQRTSGYLYLLAEADAETLMKARPDFVEAPAPAEIEDNPTDAPEN